MLVGYGIDTGAMAIGVWLLGAESLSDDKKRRYWLNGDVLSGKWMNEVILRSGGQEECGDM